MKPAYKLVPKEDVTLQIVKVDLTDVEGVSWQEVKKQLRAYYLKAAKSLRSQTEKEFNTNG